MENEIRVLAGKVNERSGNIDASFIDAGYVIGEAKGPGSKVLIYDGIMEGGAKTIEMPDEFDPSLYESYQIDVFAQLDESDPTAPLSYSYQATVIISNCSLDPEYAQPYSGISIFPYALLENIDGRLVFDENTTGIINYGRISADSDYVFEVGMFMPSPANPIDQTKGIVIGRIQGIRK